MTLHELSHDVTVLTILVMAALSLAIPAVVMSFVCVHLIGKLQADDGGRLRLDGHALHGRIVFVDRIGWEREIARWGLDSNGYMVFDWPSDHTVFTGYLIGGPEDIDPLIRTGPGAPFRSKAKEAA